MSKKIFLILLYSLVGVIAVVYISKFAYRSLAATVNAKIYLSVLNPKSTFTSGETITTGVYASADGAVSSMQFVLNFDKSKFNLVDIAPVTVSHLKTFLPARSGIFDKDSVLVQANQTGVIKMSALAYDFESKNITTSPGLPDVLLTRLTFTVKGGITNGSSTFSVLAGQGATSVVDTLVQVANLTVADASVVLGSAVGPTPTSLPDVGGWTGMGFVKNGSEYILTDTNAYISKYVTDILKPNVEYTVSADMKITTAGTSWGSPKLRLARYEDMGTAEYGESVNLNNTVGVVQKVSYKKTFTTTDLTKPIYFGVRNFGFTGQVVVSNMSLVSANVVVPTSTSVPTAIPTLKPTSTPVPTAVPTIASGIVTVSGVEASQDDVTSLSTSSWIGTGRNTSSSYFMTRFANLNLAKGAKVKSAMLSVLSSSSQWIDVKFTIRSESSDNCVVVSDTKLISSRTLNKTSTAYSDSSKWNANTWYDIKDISAQINEVLARANWKSGNSLCVIFKGNGSAYGRKFVNDSKIIINY